MKIKKEIQKYVVYGIIGFLVVGGSSFYGGMKYAQAQVPSRATRTGQFTGGPSRMVRGDSFTVGTILSKDDGSLTVKMMNGSKIVLLSASTAVMKTATGTPDDLIVGAQVSVNGTTNQDGSVSAQTIQVR